MLQKYIEKLVPQLLEMGADFLLASLRILIIVVVAYVGTRVLRAALNRMESILIAATGHTELVPGATAKRIRTLMNVLWTIVFGLIWFINGSYMQNFFLDPRLMIAGMVGLVWMAIGAFIMAKMVNFEI